MIEISWNVFSLMVALSIVCVLSILGSLCYLAEDVWGHCEPIDNSKRWKWMCIVILIILAVLLLMKQ